MRKIFILIFIGFLSSITANTTNFAKKKEVKAFINKLVKEDNFNKEALEKLFYKVQVQEYALKFYRKPKESILLQKGKSRGSWDKYEKNSLNKKRVLLGLDFFKKNYKFLEKASLKYKVPKEYITAIIGIETMYGKNTGKSFVFDSLATLAFEKNRRNKFFKKELKAFLKLSRLQNKKPKEAKGSFAGAMGLSQFMPSSYMKLAVDFNKNGQINLHENADAIGSVAKYLHLSGWDNKIPIATRVSYKGKRFTKFKTGFKHKHIRRNLKGIKPKDKSFRYKEKVHLIKLDRKNFDELWYGTKNFWVITRYNRSDYYAMGVHQLAQKIKNMSEKK